jgi:hypothetical protein
LERCRIMFGYVGLCLGWTPYILNNLRKT